MKKRRPKRGSQILNLPWRDREKIKLLHRISTFGCFGIQPDRRKPGGREEDAA
jgi:hypothetical protein